MSAVPKPREVHRMQDYEYFKARWIKEHPNATPREYERAVREIARMLGI